MNTFHPSPRPFSVATLLLVAVLGGPHAEAQRPEPPPTAYRQQPFTAHIASYRIDGTRYFHGAGGTFVDGVVTVMPERVRSGPIKVVRDGNLLRVCLLTISRDLQPYLLPLASMPLDAASETVEFSQGVTVFRDKNDRALTIYAPRAARGFVPSADQKDSVVGTYVGAPDDGSRITLNDDGTFQLSFDSSPPHTSLVTGRWHIGQQMLGGRELFLDWSEMVGVTVTFIIDAKRGVIHNWGRDNYHHLAVLFRRQ